MQTVELMTTTEFSALDEWVAARDEQQQLEAKAKKLKKQADAFAKTAQVEALQKLADVNGLVDVEPDVYPLVLAKASIKTFEFNPLFKVQVSFTTKLIGNEELENLSNTLDSERHLLEEANQAEIDVLLAEQEVLNKKIKALRTSPRIAGLEAQVKTLQESLTLPVVKSLALKKNN